MVSLFSVEHEVDMDFALISPNRVVHERIGLTNIRAFVLIVVLSWCRLAPSFLIKYEKQRRQLNTYWYDEKPRDATKDQPAAVTARQPIITVAQI
jgi:hypothetical protein